MSVLGTLLILGAALAVSRGYKRFMRDRLSELASFVDFVRFLEGRIEGYLEPLSVAAGKYKGELGAGLLDLLREGKSPNDAYLEVRGNLTLCPRADTVLLSLFETLGEGRAERELRHIRGALCELDGIYSEQRETTERSLKIAGALILAGALGLCILII